MNKIKQLLLKFKYILDNLNTRNIIVLDLVTIPESWSVEEFYNIYKNTGMIVVDSALAKPNTIGQTRILKSKIFGRKPIVVEYGKYIEDKPQSEVK